MNYLYQIYYDDSQKDNLINGLIPYKNKELKVYFENEVIKTIIEHHIINNTFDKGSCNFGFFSHDFKNTRDMFRGQRGNFELEKAERLLKEYDIVSFSYRRRKVDLVKQANIWHHPENNKAYHKRKNKDLFIEILELTCSTLSIPFNPSYKYENLVYENTFICRGSFMLDYFNEVLRPIIDLLEIESIFGGQLYELMSIDSGYRKQLPLKAQKEIGFSYYPMFPFVLERLMSIWMKEKKYKFSYY